MRSLSCKVWEIKDDLIYINGRSSWCLSSIHYNEDFIKRIIFKDFQHDRTIAFDVTENLDKNLLISKNFNKDILETLTNIDESIDPNIKCENCVFLYLKNLSNCFNKNYKEKWKKK